MLKRSGTITSQPLTSEPLASFEQVIIGNSPQIEHLVSSIRKIAGSPAITTLVIGESGTGKELVARLLHSMGSFASQPFIDINCGAIPDTLLESELFGYEKGAFTGATSDKKGLFELADGGTIFLDEIGDTTPSFQVKLLKAVENKRFRRIGGIKEIEISTRIIAATNVDLYRAAQDGKFREDLYYRLNVCQIMVPPLRERGRDVVVLARHFVEKANQQYNMNCQGIRPEAEAVLMNYHWPGNVRQLKNAIERAVIVEAGEWVEAEHFAAHLDRRRDRRQAPASDTSKAAEAVSSAISVFEMPDEGISLEHVEKQLMISALKKSHGNLSRAARLLQINRGKLRYRLEKSQIDARDYS